MSIDRSFLFDGSKIIKQFGAIVPSELKPSLIQLSNRLKIGEFFIRGTFVDVHEEPIFILGNPQHNISNKVNVQYQSKGRAGVGPDAFFSEKRI